MTMSTSTTGHEMSAELRVLVAPGNFIDGRWRDDADEGFDVIDPTTENVLTQVPQAGVAEVLAAVAGARDAFDNGPWPRMSPRERSAIMARLAERVAAYAEPLAELGVFEIGSPITLSRALHAGGPIQFLEYWADMALKGPHGRFQEGLPLADGPTVSASMLFQEPVGVVGSIIAYNYPLMLIAFKVAGALAAGCTTVLMPSPRAPLSSIAFTRIAEEVGIPEGVINLVIGGADAGQALTEHPDVDLVSFTGSVAVGRKVMAQAANGLKRVVLELGGKSPNIVLPGADVDATVGPSILRFTRNSGQGCGATTRVLVPREETERWSEGARTFMKGLVVGDPWDERTDVGPLIRREQVQSVEGYVERAREDGAEVVAQTPGAPPERGFYFMPSLFGGVDNDAEICQEELFGPVGVVIPYDTVDDAVRLANATRYGLNATVWGPTDEAMRVARRIRSGTVAINGGGPERPDAPWSGWGESSVGAERGEAGFAEFFQVKHVHWPLAGIGKPPGVR
jgi:aldehyde dehydrogenase (NAD+)/betaine-aldehyde dehydrogenase